MGLTADLGAFVAGLTEVPQAARDVARHGVVDAIGTMLAARGEAVVDAVRRGTAQPGPCGVLLEAGEASAEAAAMVNATAAHAFAMDDVAWGCHPSSTLMPVTLALAEETGASGAAMLSAYVAGYETLAELARREPDSLHATGWHPSGLLMPVAAAVAAASLLSLDASQCAHALGIAASLTGGLQGNFGTPTKALHAGRAAQAGITAARLAAAGVTAAHDALEGRKGLLATISPNGRADLTSPAHCPVDALRITHDGLSFKKYPFCYSLHRVIDAALDLAFAPEFDPSKVRAIEVSLGRRQADMAHHRRPTDGLQAKYSVEYAVAAPLLARAAGFAQLTPVMIASPDIARLIGLTERVLREDVSEDDPVFSTTDRLRVTLDDGRVLDSGEIAHARGHAKAPMGDAELRAKFVDCAALGRVPGAAALFDALAGLAGVPDVASFIRDLRMKEARA
jgi:2-methylcitrate dehydratase PrpD